MANSVAVLLSAGEGANDPLRRGRFPRLPDSNSKQFIAIFTCCRRHDKWKR